MAIVEPALKIENGGIRNSIPTENPTILVPGAIPTQMWTEEGLRPCKQMVVPQRVRTEAGLRIEKEVVDRATPEQLREIIARHGKQAKMRMERQLPKVRVAHTRPLDPVQFAAADMALPTDEVDIRYTEEIPQIDEKDIKVQIVRSATDATTSFIGQPMNAVTLQNLSNAVTTSTGLTGLDWDNWTRTDTGASTITAGATGTVRLNIPLATTGITANEAYTQVRYVCDTDSVTVTIPDIDVMNGTWSNRNVLTAAQIVKKAIRRNMNLLIKIGRGRPIGIDIDPAEIKARETLRDMITEKDWRRFITNGFIMVKGQSGFWYQIFSKGKGDIRVFKHGKKVHTICIHTDAECPPSDHVINMKVMVELDEPSVWNGGNVSPIYTPNELGAKVEAQAKIDILKPSNIVELLKEIKTNAA